MSGGRISPVETLSQTSSNATSNADDLQALQALSGKDKVISHQFTHLNRRRSVLPEPFDSDSESDDSEVQLIAYMAEPSRKRACAAVEDSVNYDPGNKPSKPSGEQSARVIRQLQKILDRQV
ncbi:hypothetical protein ACHAPG_011438 [Botrytis cinerea]